VTIETLPNSGSDLSGFFTVAGVTFVVEQQAGSIPGLSLVGSMPHLAAEGGWLTTFTLVNKGSSSATARVSMYGDGGNSLILPVNLPQQTSLSGPLLASSLDQTIAPEATFQMQATGPAGNPYIGGSAYRGLGANGGDQRQRRWIRDLPFQSKQPGSGGADGNAPRALVFTRIR
jgi:hypothetical protein